MKSSAYTRRALLAGAITVAAIAAVGGGATALADQKVVKIGISLPFTGADAEDATLIKNGILIAFDEANAAGGVAGYQIVPVIYDDGTATAGQYDPAQAATNTKKLVSDPLVVAMLGPEMSGSGKAMSPILSEADMATITPSSTNPDITDPKMAAQFRPKGKAVYFRTVTTDAYQGPNMANFYKAKLHVKTVYILDDSGAYGVGLANAFENQAKKIGIQVLGHDQLDPKEADYTTALTKIKALNPDALYYGGVAQAGVKLAKQASETIPNMIKGGGDGVAGKARREHANRRAEQQEARAEHGGECRRIAQNGARRPPGDAADVGSERHHRIRLQDRGPRQVAIGQDGGDLQADDEGGADHRRHDLRGKPGAPGADGAEEGDG